MGDVYGVVCFSKKMFTNRQKWFCHNKPESKGQPTEWKYTDSPVKKKVSGTVVSKEAHADYLL